MRCEAFLLEQDLSMSVGQRELPAAGPDDVVVRVEWAGLCGSDLHVMRTGEWVTQWPATLGHEIYGRVEGGALPAGTPVVADSRIPCGRCPACAAGEPDDCSDIAFVGEARPGGFATHVVLPASGVHAVPESVDGATAVLAEPLAVALHALAHVDGTPERVAILGHGPIGALIHAELRRRFAAAEVQVAEPAELRAALARAWNAHCAPSAAGLPEGAFDLVVDAAGYRGSLADAMTLCGRDAQLLLVAISEHEVGVRPIDVVEKRLRITGVNAFRDELPQAIELIAAEPWRYDPVVTDAVSLAELPDRVRRHLEHPDAVKVLIKP
jgi:2-desacetyl-2-hydroxyethyl bacteriochlorophyllide A dehydrogenase